MSPAICSPDIERARKDRPGLALTEVADAVYSYYVERDYPTALAEVGRVLERDANDVERLAVGLDRNVEHGDRVAGGYRARQRSDAHLGRTALVVGARHGPPGTAEDQGRQVNLGQAAIGEVHVHFEDILS